MRKFQNRFVILLIFSFIFSASAFCQEQLNIDYYGIVANDIDSNMSKMTSDLYYTQLCEINNYVVTDKRINSSMEETPETSILSSTNLSFYAIISKKENSSKWLATITLIDKQNNSKQSETKEYDSYYKILMEPKSVLQTSIKNLIDKKDISPNETTPFDMPVKKSELASTEFLSGTWSGEDNVDKIVIMRGGRGFVIFTNGASMNITVELQNIDDSKHIVITQNGRANASYFPELSRQVALKEAISAAPIQWVLSIDNDNTLSGVKNTLIEKDGAAINASLNVIWKRKS